MKALENWAKTVAKINVQAAIHLAEFRHSRSGYLEFDTNRARPPYCSLSRMSSGTGKG
jgi:hypothetical protein